MLLHPNRQVPLFLVIVALFNAILLYSLPLLPFIDLPNHLAEATIYKYAQNSNEILGDYYKAVPWYYPNTFHSVFCSLFPSVEVGNKTFYVLYIVALQVSLYGIIKEVKGNQWYGLLSILLLYGYNVTYGFTGFTIAIPTTLFLFLVILKDAKKGHGLYKVAAAFILILLYLMHAQMALFGLMLYGASMVYRHWGHFLKMIVSVLVVSLPVVLMVGVWWLNRAAEAQEEKSTLDFLLQYYKGTYFPELWLRFRLLTFDNYTLRGGATGYIIAGIFSFCLLVPLIWLKGYKNLQKRVLLQGSAVYSLIFLVISAGCYFFLPSKLPGQAPLYERFGTVVLLALIIVGSILLKSVQARALKIFVLAVALVYSLLWTEYFYTFNKQNKEFRPELFAGIPKDAKIGGLIYNFSFRGRTPYVHFPSYYITWQKGPAASKIIDYRFGVVRRGEKGDQIPFYQEWIGRYYSKQAQYDSTLNYLLVKGKAPVQPDSNLVNTTLVKEAGHWKLYKNNLIY